MGTSSQFGGSSSSLVPSWLDDPSPAPAQSTDLDSEEQSPLPLSPTLPLPKQASPLSTPKGGYTRYLNSGGSGLRKALKSYGSHSGGRGGSVRRMGSSRTTAGGLATFFNSLQQNGSQETLKKFNLSEYVDRPVEDTLIALSEVICTPGGTIDEGIARDAMHETIGEIIEAGVEDLDSLTEAQQQELLVSFITHSIKGRIINDIGHGMVKFPTNNAQVEELQIGLIEFTRSNVREAVKDHYTSDHILLENEISQMVDSMYGDAISLMTELIEDIE